MPRWEFKRIFRYPGLEAAGKLFDVPLPEPAGQPRELPFGQESLVAVHVFVIGVGGADGTLGEPA